MLMAVADTVDCPEPMLPDLIRNVALPCKPNYATRFPRSLLTLGAAALIATTTCAAGAEGVPDNAFDWVTIGAPGNRHTIPSEVPLLPDREVGAVAYEYRLTRTEVTVGQWLQFAQAYVRWNPAAADDSSLRGPFIGVHFDGTLFTGSYLSTVPNKSSWRWSARFCNWLHNGKADAPWAFETGAYDASTFTQNPDGSVNDQFERSPGARYWIPSRDEWVKGAFYDPNRYGDGQGGYWLYPNTSDTLPISGLPELGGETNAGFDVPRSRYPMTAGSYPLVRSPWGLLDVSGGESELTETVPPGLMYAEVRITLGSAFGDFIYQIVDRPDDLRTGLTSVRSGLTGLRLASAIPSPASVAPLVLMLFIWCRRRS